MHQTESLRRHAHLAEASRCFLSDTGERELVLRRAAESPEGPLAPHQPARVERVVEIVMVPISHIDMMKETKKFPLHLGLWSHGRARPSRMATRHCDVRRAGTSA